MSAVKSNEHASVLGLCRKFIKNMMLPRIGGSGTAHEWREWWKSSVDGFKGGAASGVRLTRQSQLPKGSWPKLRYAVE